MDNVPSSPVELERNKKNGIKWFLVLFVLFICSFNFFSSFIRPLPPLWLHPQSAPIVSSWRELREEEIEVSWGEKNEFFFVGHFRRCCHCWCFYWWWWCLLWMQWMCDDNRSGQVIDSLFPVEGVSEWTVWLWEIEKESEKNFCCDVFFVTRKGGK